MIHPHTEVRFINNEIGYGVFATQFIPQGTMTWVFDKLDRKFTSQEFLALDEPYQHVLYKYCFRDREGNLVFCWDNNRYVNHSFNPTSLFTAYNFELAVRDIYPGEELTSDYGCLNITESFCAADEGLHRKVVYPDDLLRYYQLWDKQLHAAFQFFQAVDQPLRKLLAPEAWETCCKIAVGKEEMISILSCYCPAVMPLSTNPPNKTG